MKFQIKKLTYQNEAPRIVEAKSAYAAMKKISGNMATIAKCASLTAKYGAPVFSKGWEGHIHRNHFMVTEVAPDVIAEVVTEENVFGIMMTYTDAKLIDIVTTHSLRNTKVDQRITEAAAQELANR